MGYLGRAWLPVALLAAGAPAWAEGDAGTGMDVRVETIEVPATPLPGAGFARVAVPERTETLDADDVARTQVPSLTRAITEQVPGASVSDVEGNPFQSDIVFRGYTASPAAGGAQGLAVYVNGARFNDPFGDTVNWDLIPSAAIEQVSIEATNPVFGLNALGGSVSVRLKNGFTAPGASLTAIGGSFDRGTGILEYGRSFGATALYLAGEVTHDGGYRRTGSSDIYRVYGDLGWRNEAAEVHLGLTAASNRLGNPGASPVQVLDVGIDRIFTAPNDVYNKYLGADLRGEWRLSDQLSVQAVGYFHYLQQRIPNGITTEIAPCDDTDNAGLLCSGEGEPVTGRNGQPIPDFLAGGPYSGLSRQGLDSNAYGASAQLAYRHNLLGLSNKIVAGGSFDGSDTVFDGAQDIGGFNPYTGAFLGPGVTIDDPELGINPVRVATTGRAFGLFAADVLTLLPGLDLSLTGRFNNVQIDLDDKLGGPVRGRHAYSRFNPSVGLSWRVAPALRLYANYAETNRVPTPQELSCASPETPCTLLNFFVGDPALRQVISRGGEAGADGTLPVAGGTLRWSADAYLRRNSDDLIYQSIATDPNLNYFSNAGKTQRLGVEATLRYARGPLTLSVTYAYTRATFESPLVLNSLDNPAADPSGQIAVRPGDRLPGVPLHRGTIVAGWDVTDRVTVGGSLVLNGAFFRLGDEANLTKQVGGYAVLNLNGSWRVRDDVMVFAALDNVLDQRYATFGGFGPVDQVPFPYVPGGVSDTRTASPGLPRAIYGGVRVTFR